MTAYYNEHDPFAAAWLRQLIEHGHIAPGVVDERSIEDVVPAELAAYTQCHFFAGIGVWSYALRSAGWADDRPIWTGSCPCQPFSAAGKGNGFDDERHLWPAFHWLIGQCKPPIVIGEQVASKDGLAWWELVSSDLEISGYPNAAVDFCAASVGAPHIRQRLYWMAYAASGGSRSGLRDSGSSEQWRNVIADDRSNDGVVHPDHAVSTGLERFGSGYSSEIGRDGKVRPVTETGEFGGMGDTESNRRRIELGSIPSSTGENERAISGYGNAVGSDGSINRLADANGADASTEWKQRSGQFGQQPQDGRSVPNGRTSPINGFWRNADWIFCRDGKWRPVESGTFPLVNGSTNRLGRLRGYGNAIVAPQAQIFIETVMEILSPLTSA